MHKDGNKRIKVSEIENRKTIEKLIKTKNLFFDKIDKIYNPLD